jgi:hypothetical protein
MAEPPAPPPTLVDVVVRALSGPGFDAFRADYLLRGYTIVGSLALLGDAVDGDADLVLLSEKPPTGGADAVAILAQLLRILRDAVAPQGCVAYLVQPRFSASQRGGPMFTGTRSVLCGVDGRETGFLSPAPTNVRAGRGAHRQGPPRGGRPRPVVDVGRDDP